MNSPKTTQNKKQYAYEVIRARILDGTYGPGYRIVIDQVARELGLSAIPIREAIRQLEADGLIQFKPYSGAQVSPINEVEYLETLSVLAVLEGYATALSSLRFPKEKLPDLVAINEEMERSLDEFDFYRFGQLNRAFHTEIYRQCDNAYLVENIMQTCRRIDALRRSGQLFVPERARQSVREHETIIHMLRDRASFSQIEQFVREHKLNTVRAFMNRKAQQGNREVQ
ncbi:GntR family transcriptional regulator [Effusibacillus pohliae]|uniref:GntR family transcriptional regulator n=1 Tax=Effusibacillus pohliae TaxID=232270 RepID=UPI00035CAB75|nr:GntR family transcriptional regulator [Effusibacillus pohliae]